MRNLWLGGLIDGLRVVTVETVDENFVGTGGENRKQGLAGRAEEGKGGMSLGGKVIR